jgi:hypothetical protein
VFCRNVHSDTDKALGVRGWLVPTVDSDIYRILGIAAFKFDKQAGLWILLYDGVVGEKYLFVLLI